jgi:hypothetical protein
MNPAGGGNHPTYKLLKFAVEVRQGGEGWWKFDAFLFQESLYCSCGHALRILGPAVFLKAIGHPGSKFLPYLVISA